MALSALLAATPAIAESAARTDDTAPSETSTAAVERCVVDHEAARLRRVQEQWLAAREAMQRCADARCPLALRSDCSAWLDELTALMPSLLIVVERDDDRSEPLRLELDGQALDLPEPLGPIEVLPGRHRLRAELPPYPLIEREIVVEKGEKNQVVRLRFVRAAPPSFPSAPRPPQSQSQSSRSRPIPALSYWFGGGALLAFAGSGVLLGSALSSLAAARDSCSPGCEPGVRDSIDARLLAADVVGGAGVVLGGLALYTFLSRPVVDSRATLRPSLGLSNRSALFALEGKF
jgi:hypothetical protein